MPFEWLVNGFTTLDQSLVPAAYAQSLFATRSLINKYGINKILEYLHEISDGESQKKAFESVYGFSLSHYEKQLTGQMRTWAKSNKYHP